MGFKRTLEEQLEQWRKNDSRKPLIIEKQAAAATYFASFLVLLFVHQTVLPL